MAEPTLGQNLKEARETARLGLRQLARLARVDAGYLSQIENDLRKPSRRVLEKIEEALAGEEEHHKRRKSDGSDSGGGAEVAGWCAKLVDAVLTNKPIAETEFLLGKVNESVRKILDRRHKKEPS